VLALRAILRLTRLGTSLLGFAAIFFPLLVRTSDLRMSLGRAIPLLFICLCTFIANDLDDVERDRVNHPERPLPAGQLAPAVAGIMYFTSLFLALFSTKYYVTQGIAFWYYGLIAISISYGYVIECFPSLKAPYVAATSSVPILIIAGWYPDETRLYILAGSVFLVSLGREICMDITDRAGDALSFMHRFRPRPLAIAAFCVEAVGVLLLLFQVRRPRDLAALLSTALLLAIAAVYWFKFSSYHRASFIMKLQLVVGLYFLA
jgi:geranylgeranylglycerol-phosphate geranylgeranyltransferase